MNTTTDMTTNTDGAMPELYQMARDAGLPMSWLDKGISTTWPELERFADSIRRAAIQQAAGAVPQGLADLLQSCRGSIKADLWRYEQMLLVQQVPHLHAVVKSEIDRLRALLDSIDALAASPAPPKQQPVHLGGGEGGRVPEIDWPAVGRIIEVHYRTRGVHTAGTSNWGAAIWRAAHGIGANKPATAGQGMEGGDHG